LSKLLVAVVHDLDADEVISALEDEGHRVTRIPSIGGYLQMENSTLLIGVEDEAMSEVLAILERECSTRELEPPPVLAGRQKDKLPHVIRHGGATVFVADLEGIVRI
jgi:uncharacterized protein YaaQ